jgi:hypothetical protein
LIHKVFASNHSLVRFLAGTSPIWFAGSPRVLCLSGGFNAPDPFRHINLPIDDGLECLLGSVNSASASSPKSPVLIASCHCAPF